MSQLDLFPVTFTSIKEEYSFRFKTIRGASEPDQRDFLMDATGVDQDDYELNKQYYCRHLGTMWESLVRHSFGDAPHAPDVDGGELADVLWRGIGIECKYRVRSGDGNFWNRLKVKGLKLSAMSVRPVLLVCRTDNLEMLYDTARRGGWDLKEGQDGLDWVRDMTGIYLPDKL